MAGAWKIEVWKTLSGDVTKNMGSAMKNITNKNFGLQKEARRFY